MMARFLTSDGLSLHYEDEGRGPPVLCLAGLTRNGADFQFLLPHLGSATVETRNAMGFRALDNIDAFVAGKDVPFTV